MRVTPHTAEFPQPVDEAAAARRERLRFTGFHLSRTSSGDCSVEVELEWVAGAIMRGRATGPSSPLLDLRVAAEAALRAIEAATAGEASFELIGVKQLRAFDATVVIVAVANRSGDGPRRLIGSYLADDDPVRGTVVAVLAATNRVFGNMIARR